MKTRQWLGREADSSTYVLTYIESRAFTPDSLGFIFSAGDGIKGLPDARQAFQH